MTNSFVAHEPDDREMVVKESPIERIEVISPESTESQYRVRVLSRLPRGSSCSRFNGYDVSRPFANTIHVTVTHLEVAELNVPCTRDLPVVETEVLLGSDFTSGEEYTIKVNEDAVETFQAQ